MTSYYRTKASGCLDQVVTFVRQQPSGGEPPTLVGFLAQSFGDSPSERDRLLKAEPSDRMKSIYLVSLHRAGLSDEAQKLATASNLAALNDKLRAARLAPLNAVQPSSVPGDNDLLLGAYMASGNTAFIEKILANYASADDGMVSDGLRIGFMMSKFGPGLAPKGREAVTPRVACEKYQCKIDHAKLLRVMTLATAHWSLQSLAAKDEGIKKTLGAFFTSNARLKNLYAAESTAFSNYLTALVLVTALKGDQKNAGQEQVVAAMGKSASIYENLGPPNEAFAPMTTLKKN